MPGEVVGSVEVVDTVVEVGSEPATGAGAVRLHALNAMPAATTPTTRIHLCDMQSPQSRANAAASSRSASR